MIQFLLFPLGNSVGKRIGTDLSILDADLQNKCIAVFHE